ncbi:MAG: D-arabinono-1,4-lactone oxidase [Jatrophihabitantaceae bacterium]
MATWTNWAGNVSADVVLQSPRSVEGVQHAITTAVQNHMYVKPIGAGHSFTAIGRPGGGSPGDSGVARRAGVQLQLDRLAGILRADRETGLVTVLAGTRLHDLNGALWQLGLSMSNLGDIDVQTISGAISTGTHGTGIVLGGIATQVRALQLVLADGTLLNCSPEQNPEVFAAARVGLGALGVLTTVTLQCEPAFALAAAESPEPLDDVLVDLDANVDGNDHFEFYWFPHTRRTLTKRNNRVLPDTPLQPLGRVRQYIDDELLSNTVFDAINKLTTRRPTLIPRLNAFAARAMSARGYIDRSYNVFASPRRVKFREMEYAVPRAAVPQVLGEIEEYLTRSGEQIGFPVEVRFAAADDIWLSTAQGRDTGYIAVHQYIRRDHEPYFRAVEAIAKDVDGRPHWGKLHFRDAESLRATYSKFDDFVALRDRLDPQRLFGNDYLARVLGP